MQRALRQDIQFLRGIAVLAVVLFHTRLDILVGGYLGVDIFFVISGFLITGMIAKQLSEKRFSFKAFYFRRAKRLLPAAYVTFALTSIAASFLLTAQDYLLFARQVFGAVTFTANIFLSRQGSYFGGEADLKPLLHTWSLSIEEQYYVIVPAMLAFLPMRWWLRVALILTAISLAACIVAGYRQPSLAFYMFPMRAWEMGIGSVGALIAERASVRRIVVPLFWPALAAILVLLVFPIGGLHPGADAVLACLATLVVILRAHVGFDAPVFKPVTWVGDISYSLYLVHWPLFALANHMWIGDLPLPVTLGLLIASLVVAWLQYSLVEQPVHKARFGFTWPRAAMALTASAMVITLPIVAIALGRAPARFVEERRGVTGFVPSCVSDRSFAFSRACATSNRPTVLVWGDSYAMHLIPGIVQERGAQEIAQATKYICGPILGISPLSHLQGSEQNEYWAKGCLSYNDDVFAYLKATPTIHTVILASVFDSYMYDGINLYADGKGELAGGVAPAVKAFDVTIRRIRALGKKVVVVGPPPALRWDAGRCVERRLRSLPTFGRFADCNIPDADYKPFRARVLRFVSAVRTTSDVDVIMFDDYLRRGDHYVTWPTRRIWFITNGHFSYQGSRDIIRGMGLMPRAMATAR